MEAIRIEIPHEIINESILEIREALYENMTINDEVRKISISVGNRVMEAIPKSPMTKDESGNRIKTGEINFVRGEVRINVSWSARFYDSKDLGNMPNNTAISNFARHFIKVNVVVVDGKIDKAGLFESIQHEVHHLFERFKRGKEYNDMDRYRLAYNNLLEYQDTITYKVCSILYIAFTFEQRAYLNGAYAKLMNSDDYDNGFENAIKETKLFQFLGAVKYFYGYIKELPLDNEELKDILTDLELDRKRFLQMAKITIIRIENSIARVIKKAKKDYSAKHNIVEYAPSAFEFPISEQTSRKRAERRLKAIKKHLIWPQ